MIFQVFSLTIFWLIPEIAKNKKHLVVILDKRFDFYHHLSEKIVKANKGIGLIMKLRKSLSQAASVEHLQNCIVNLDWRALPIDVFVGDFGSSTM